MGEDVDRNHIHLRTASGKVHGSIQTQVFNLSKQLAKSLKYSELDDEVCEEVIELFTQLCESVNIKPQTALILEQPSS